MRRFLCACLFGLMAATVAHGHALYIVPNSDDPTRVTVVFSDSLEPDERVKAESWKKVAGLKLQAIQANGRSQEVSWSQAEHAIQVTAPAGTRVIQGVVDYGVYQKGDAKPMFIKFYPKAIIGSIPVDGGKTDAALQIVPQVNAGHVRFQVLLKGQPVKDAKLTLIVPGDDKTDAHDPKAGVSTDENGLTPAFSAKGRYGVTARHVESTSGEADGKSYDSITHVATLVVDVK